MAVIYIATGVAIVVRAAGTDQPVQTHVAGWIVGGYGVYRLVSRLVLHNTGNRQ